jgi:hypothetical protein
MSFDLYALWTFCQRAANRGDYSKVFVLFGMMERMCVRREA